MTFIGKLAEEKKEEAPKPPPGGFKLHGHTHFQGLRLAIENRKGSVRKGVDKDGKPWRTVMKNPYGYLVGTKGKDGEEIDAYLGPNKKAPYVFVVHQKTDAGGHDEDKCIFGVDSEEEAKKLYLAHYNTDKYLGPITRVSVDHLKELLDSRKRIEKISSPAFWKAAHRLWEITRGRV